MDKESEMTAREVIEKALVEIEGNSWDRVFADSVLSALEQAGYRVVSSYEWDLREAQIKGETEAACVEAVTRLRS
jgi:hypothetical protein